MQVLFIDRFGHQLGCGERSGGLGTAKFHVFSVRVFLDMSQEALINNIVEFLGQTCWCFKFSFFPSHHGYEQEFEKICNLKESVYSRHPDPRRVWKGGSEQHLLTPLPWAPGANAKKLYVAVFYGVFEKCLFQFW